MTVLMISVLHDHEGVDQSSIEVMSVSDSFDKKYLHFVVELTTTAVEVAFGS